MQYNNRSSEESVFNMALSYLQGIKESLDACKGAAINQNVDSWCTYLRMAYRELTVKLSDKEMELIDGSKVTINFDDKITEDEATFKNLYFMLNNPQIKIRYKSIILFLEDKLEIKIRRKLQEKGMLLPSKEDPRWAVLQR